MTIISEFLALSLVKKQARRANLICLLTGMWNDNLLTSLFWPVDRERILLVAIGGLETRDRVVWHFTKNDNPMCCFLYLILGVAYSSSTVIER